MYKYLSLLVLLAIGLPNSSHADSKNPSKITGYTPGNKVALSDVEYSFVYFNDDLITKDYLVKSKSEKSVSPYEIIGAVQTGDNELSIYKVRVAVDDCDGALNSIDIIGNPKAKVKFEKCQSKADGLRAQLPTIYGNKYNYYSNKSSDDNFDPASKCIIETKSIHGMHLDCQKWLTPPANRILLEFTGLGIGGVCTRIFDKKYAGGVVEKSVDYGDTSGTQIVFTWHNEFLENKYEKIGREYLNKKKSAADRKAAESSDLFK